MEQEAWRRSDPERNARANKMVELYEKSVADVEAQLQQARAAGDDTSALEADLKGKRELLTPPASTPEKPGEVAVGAAAAAGRWRRSC